MVWSASVPRSDLQVHHWEVRTYGTVPPPREESLCHRQHFLQLIPTAVLAIRPILLWKYRFKFITNTILAFYVCLLIKRLLSNFCFLTLFQSCLFLPTNPFCFHTQYHRLSSIDWRNDTDPHKECPHASSSSWQRGRSFPHCSPVHKLANHWKGIWYCSLISQLHTVIFTTSRTSEAESLTVQRVQSDLVNGPEQSSLLHGSTGLQKRNSHNPVHMLLGIQCDYTHSSFGCGRHFWDRSTPSSLGR